MSDRLKLTSRQEAIYTFIRDKIVNRGYGPTVREIGAEFGIKSPNGVMCHLKALEKKGLIIREQNMSRAIQLTDPPKRSSAQIPLLGQIAAGSPTLAVEQQEYADFSHLFDNPDLFGLKVRGDSMIEAHISDGDLAVIRKQSTARDGEIVAALVDGEEATLKYFYREPGRIRLQPANSTMLPIFSQDVQILGTLESIVRFY